MKFTLSWLKQHLETDASLDEIVEAMVKVGLEVEEVENPAERVAAITVGHVKAAAPHPDADKLQVCTVETKDGDMQIVCGAPNARAGINVAYAPVGTYISGIDVTLSKAKIRGVESFGMLCSARELEIGEDHDGIMELPQGAEVGTPISDVLGLNDPVIDFEVTPNRPDTNGIDGVARDLAAAGIGTLKTERPEAIEGQFPQPVPIEIDDLEACPAFAGRLIRGVKNGPSPQWLQDQLRAIGLRPISALVDITNFLSYDRARPLHVYDAAKVTGTIRARLGRAGESFLALDGKEYAVDETMTVIADDARVLGLGGVMGGEYSGCTEETTDVLIEAALFDPLRTARTGRKTGIVSDARYRFERGVDPLSVLPGLELATKLVLDFCGGEPSDITLTGEIPTETKTIEFPPAEVERLTGMEIADSEKERILTALGFDVKRGGTWDVSVPSYRPDIMGKADLVEEVARIHGLDDLPSTPMRAIPGEARPQPGRMDQLGWTLREAMTAAGYDETVTWAFCGEEEAKLFGSDGLLTLSNPISAELGVMRPNALPHLVAAIGRNQARGVGHVCLFEIGGCYRDDTPNGQDTVLTAAAYGTPPKSWVGTRSAPDVFAAKALAISALAAAGAPVDNLSTFADGPDYLHPGRKGALGLGPKKILARFGEIHPRVLKLLDVNGPISVVEIYLDHIPAPRAKAGKTKPPLMASTLMPVRRDFAFVVDKSAPAESLLRAVKGADKTLITDVRLFDVYEGTGLGDDEKSLAIEVVIQPTEKTLTDKEIDAVSEKVVAQAQKAVGATLRG